MDGFINQLHCSCSISGGDDGGSGSGSSGGISGRIRSICHPFPANTGFGFVVFLLDCEGPKEQRKKEPESGFKEGKRLPLRIFFAVVSVF